MATEFKGKIDVDIRDSEPDWGPYVAPTAPKGAPNVLYLVWDDTGIATWDCFGGLVEMPAMSRSPNAGCGCRSSTPPRCARPPGRRC